MKAWPISVGVLFIFTVLISSVQGASFPFVDQVEKALQSDIGEQDPIAQPEPVALNPDWWRYFEVGGSTLEQRVQALLSRLDALLAELSVDTQASVRPVIQVIRLNLQALPRAKSQPTPELPPPNTYRQTYTLSQLLTIAERLRSLQNELREERDDIAATERAVRIKSRHVDTLMAAYLGLAASDASRLEQGLQIIAERSAIAVAQERMRVRKAEMAANEVLVKQLVDEQQVAIQRLVAERGDLYALEQAIEQAQARLRETELRSTNEQSRALNVVGESPEDKATERNRQQRVVQALVEEAIARVRVLRLQTEKQLVSLILPDTEVDGRILRRLLEGWESRLSDIRRQAYTWTVRSDRERQRAGDLVAVAPMEAPVLTSVALINEERLRVAQDTLVALQRLDDELTQVDLIVRLVDEKLIRREGGFGNWWLHLEYVFTQAWDKSAAWITTSLFKIGETPVTALGLLRVIVILTVAWWLSYGFRKGLDRLSQRREDLDCSALYTVGRLSHYVLIIIGFIVGLASIGVDFTNFALVAGAIAIGIGFGLQSIVNNFVSGLILLFERSLKVGDFVELASGTAGEVREINVRSTLINTNDNVDIVVPNSEFMNTQVINWTLSEGFCRIHLPFRIAYGADKEKVRQAGLEAAEKLPHTLRGVPGKNPGVWLVRFGESCLEFELVVWLTPRAVKRPGAVQAAYLWEIDSALRRHNIQVPFPQRDLHLRTGFRELIATHDYEPEAGKLGVVLEKP
jgi:small-conductance mechanosensitive channel